MDSGLDLSDKLILLIFQRFLRLQSLQEKYSPVTYDFCPLSKAGQRTKIGIGDYFSRKQQSISNRNGSNARSQAMTIFDASEKIELIASQNFKYDCYSDYKYYLERVDVSGKCGLVYVEEKENCGVHPMVLLQPIYNDIKVCKVSTPKANYDKYVVYANGKRLGEFTMVINEWILQCNN